MTRITPHQKQALDAINRGGIHEYTTRDGAEPFWAADRGGTPHTITIHSLIKRGLAVLCPRTAEGDHWRRNLILTNAGLAALENAPATQPIKHTKAAGLTRYQAAILQAVADGKVSKPNRRYADWWIVDPERDSGYRPLSSAMRILEDRGLVEKGTPGLKYTPAVLTAAGEAARAAVAARRTAKLPARQ
jgi:hypothetical protein